MFTHVYACFRNVCACLRSVCAMFAHVFLCKPLSANMRKQKFHFMFTHVYACLRMFSQCLRNVYAFQLVSANTAQYSSNQMLAHVCVCLRIRMFTHVYAFTHIYAFLRNFYEFSYVHAIFTYLRNLRNVACLRNWHAFTNIPHLKTSSRGGAEAATCPETSCT